MWSGLLAPEVHLVAGNRQWRLAGTAGGPYGGLSEVRVLTAAVVDACQLGTRLLFAHGTAAHVSSVDLAAGSYTTSFYQNTAKFVGSDGQAGYLVPTQPRKIADALWAAAQGAISLERAGHLRDGRTYEAVTTSTISCYLVEKRD